MNKMFINRISLLVGILLFWSVQLAWSQVRVEGTVLNSQDKAIKGANVYILDSYDGTSTDSLGHFGFVTELEGSQILIISYVGFESANIPIDLDAGTPAIHIELKEDISTMDPVVITAGTFEAGMSGKGEVLKPLDIVTTAGATADIAGALNTLPGTTTVGEEGRLFVRGGDGSETLTFIDGLGVLDSYSTTLPNVATRSRFSPMMFSGMSFSTGGYSAEYGRALSSALILNQKSVALQDRTDLSFMTVGLDVAHTEAFDNASFSGKIQYTNLTPYMALVPQRLDWISAPESIETNVAYRRSTDKLDLKTYGMWNWSTMKVNHRPVGIDTSIATTVNNQYLYLNTFLSHPISLKSSVRGGVSLTRSKTDAIQPQGSQSDDLKGVHVKGAFLLDPLRFLTLNLGTEVFVNHIDQRLGSSDTDFTNKFYQTINASFVEGTWAISNYVSLRTGIRAEYYSNLDLWSFDPRLSLAIKAGQSSQLGASWGLFRQNVNYEFLLGDNNLQQQEAEHYILSYQVKIKNRVLRLEAYNKQYDQLIKVDNSGSLSNRGDGYARGIDLFWRDNRTFQNIDYWISYSYVKTERNYLNYPTASVPGFVASHNFSFVYKHWFQTLRSQLGLTYTLASPRSYDDPNQDAFNSGRTPSYHDLSMNISYLAKPNLIVYFSMTNVLGIKNIYGYEFSPRPDENGLYASRAIVPPADRFLFLGVFLTLSKENTMNQLPNL